MISVDKVWLSKHFVDIVSEIVWTESHLDYHESITQAE